jgi:vacuolar-type H+-ATPase subunit F/Vma7
MDIYVKKMADLSNTEEIKIIFIHRELLSQLKEISKRMRMTANSLEDIIMKII